VGAGLAVWHQYENRPRSAVLGARLDSQHGSYLGPEFSQSEVESYLRSQSAPYTIVSDEQLLPRVAQFIAGGKIIGWFSGRMEFGPRALGARSIIGDARDPEMQKRMNVKIKFRESFRPFAPAVLAEHVSEWFDLDRPSPYMLLVADVKKKHQIAMSDEQQRLFGIDKLNVKRSSIPAVTHVDYSARVQTVHRETNPRFHALLSEFHRISGCPVVVNTSFNVRGEPIVCTPDDAYRCFMNTDIDVLILGNALLLKEEQPQTIGAKREFEPD
jgi:carbamoyltransferase